MNFYSALEGMTEEEVIVEIGRKNEKGITSQSLITVLTFLEYDENYKDKLLLIALPNTYDDLEDWNNKGGIISIKEEAFMYLKQRLNLKTIEQNK
jgi:hypothetical protein